MLYHNFQFIISMLNRHAWIDPTSRVSNDDDGEGGGDSVVVRRSPHAWLNVLANHGYINYNGTDIDVEELSRHYADVYGVSTDFTKHAVDAAVIKYVSCLTKEITLLLLLLLLLLPFGVSTFPFLSSSSTTSIDLILLIQSCDILPAPRPIQ